MSPASEASEGNSAVSAVSAVSAMQSGAVELRLVSDAPGRGVTVDFSTFRGEHLGRHSLVRAIGKGSGAVIDATAGLGADAWLIAASGRRVIALERCAAVHAVLADGLARARADPSLHVVAQRITLHQADSIASLERVLAEARAAGEAVDAIFVDPMYPHSDSSALPPRDIRLVRAAAGDDTDADQLFAAACGCGTARVVVRRPHRAPPMELPSGAPVRAPLNAQFKSTLVRYDLYLPVRVSREA